jgi:hypothetical protein
MIRRPADRACSPGAGPASTGGEVVRLSGPFSASFVPLDFRG